MMELDRPRIYEHMFEEKALSTGTARRWPFGGPAETAIVFC
jgi:hypothetical protein